MEPSVPFSLVAASQLLWTSAMLGIAGTALAPRLRQPRSALLVIGALTLAGAAVAAGSDIGNTTSDTLAIVNAVGFALVAAGLGVVRSALPYALGAYVVVPLGAGSTPSVAAGAMALSVAAVATSRHPRSRAGLMLGGGFVLAALGAFMAPAAREHSSAAWVVLTARGVGSLLIIAVLALLTRTTVLGKVVGSIIGGVLFMAVVAVPVVGTVVADQVQHQQSKQIASVATAQQDRLAALETQLQALSHVVVGCVNEHTDHTVCGNVLKTFTDQPVLFAFSVDRHFHPTQYVPTGQRPLSAIALLQIARSGAVQTAFGRNGTSGLAYAPAQSQPVVALGATPTDSSGHPAQVAVFGVPLGTSYLQNVKGLTGGTYDLTEIVQGRAVVSTLSSSDALTVALDSVQRGLVETTLGADSVDVFPAAGSRPTIAYTPLVSGGNAPIGLLAVSQPPNVAQSAQRAALRTLLFTALGVVLVIIFFAIGLGRRIVEPIRRLTQAAARVRAGDLEVVSGIRTTDEVGRLSRAFDEMTASLAESTEELRYAAEQEATLRTRLEAALSAMTDALVVTTADGRISLVNPAASRLIAYDGEVIGQPVRSVFDVRNETGDVVVLTEPPQFTDGALYRQDGDVVPVRVESAALDDGRGAVIVLRDMRREREIERLKTEFLSNVSHELRTPLTPIRGYAEILKRRPDLKRDQVAAYVDTILDSSVRMARVVDLLVDVAALEAGRVSAAPRPVKIGSYIDERLDLWRKRMPSRSGDLKRRVATGMPSVAIDPAWVGKALDELIDNALKYSPPGTPVTLAAARTDDGWVRLCVRDFGPGIDPDELPRLFEDFAQADASATRTVGGLGLGLAFVRRLVRELGLRIEVHSELGSGTEVFLDLPVSTTAARRSSPAPPRQRSAGGANRTRKVLAQRRRQPPRPKRER